MAFPGNTTTVQTWSGSSAPPNGSWSLEGGFSFDIKGDGAGNVTGQAGVFCSDYLNTGTYGPDCCFYVPATAVSGSDFACIQIRLASPASGSVKNGYQFYINGSNWVIRRIDNNVYTQLGAAATQAVSAGDYFGVEGIGPTLTAYRCPAASDPTNSANWTQIIQRTDATYSAAGNVGIEINNTTYKVGTLAGGSIVTASGPATVVGLLTMPPFRRTDRRW